MDFAQHMMRQALEPAKYAASVGEVPVGALISRGNDVISVWGNRCENEGDPLAHAEMIVINDAINKLGKMYLDDCALFVTLEPCAMCAGAIAAARLGKVYFGAYDPKSGGTEHGARVFDHPQCHWKPEVYGGILEAECSQLLKDFFAQRR